MSGASWQRVLVRLSCEHEVTYCGAPPRPGSAVWCLRCDKGRTVAARVRPVRYRRPRSGAVS